MNPTEVDGKPVAIRAQPIPTTRQLTLLLRPVSAPVHYAVTAAWSETCHGEATRNATEKQLAVQLSTRPAGWEVTVEWAAAPVLSKTQPVPFDAVTLLLAGLYRRLVLQASPTGQLLELLNQPEIAHTWAGLRQQLMAEREQDEVAVFLCETLDGQVQNAGQLLRSLHFDYFFPLFFKDVYGQSFNNQHTYTRPVTFPQFFAEVPLVFQETMSCLPPDAPDHTATLHFVGVMDEQRTHRAAVAQAMTDRLGAAHPVEPAEIEFSYEATHQLSKATGLPVALDVVVTCFVRPLYKKEYALTVRQL